jgi:hypothetical protein
MANCIDCKPLELFIHRWLPCPDPDINTDVPTTDDCFSRTKLTNNAHISPFFVVLLSICSGFSLPSDWQCKKTISVVCCAR